MNVSVPASDVTTVLSRYLVNPQPKAKKQKYKFKAVVDGKQYRYGS